MATLVTEGNPAGAKPLISEVTADENTVVPNATSGTSLDIKAATESVRQVSLLPASTTEECGKFQFIPLPSEFPLGKEREDKTYLKKWGLESDMVYGRFRFDEAFTEEKIPNFLKDFFNSRQVQGTLKVSGRRSGLVAMMGEATGVDFDTLRTTVLNMSFFDRLKGENITGGDGYIRGCMPERYHGCEGGSLFREMFLNEDSEAYLAYDDDERAEFLFHIMQAIGIGGSMCQPETNIKAYLDCAKRIYKALVTVRKRAHTKELYVDSTVLSVTGIKGSLGLFPDPENPLNYCYLSVDKSRRQVHYWSAAFVDFW